MASFRNGDHEAAGRLIEFFYPELRRIAAARMRAERPHHTLQPTAVVHQLYLELVKASVARAARLMRLFNEQLAAMAKLKGKAGQQKVTVEHVHVHSGGQAVVGVVERSQESKEGK